MTSKLTLIIHTFAEQIYYTGNNLLPTEPFFSSWIFQPSTASTLTPLDVDQGLGLKTPPPPMKSPGY